MLAAKEWVSVWPNMGFQVYVTSSIFRASMKVILFLEDGFKLLICIMLNWQIYGPLSESRAIPVSRSPVGMIYSSEECEKVKYLQFSLALTSLHEIFYKPEEKVWTNSYNQQYGNGQHIIDPGEVSKTIFVTTIFACFSNSSKIFEVNLNHNLHLFTSCCCFHTSNFIDNYSDQTLEKHRRTCFSLFSYHLYHNSTALPYVFISGYYLASSQSTKY